MRGPALAPPVACLLVAAIAVAAWSGAQSLDAHAARTPPRRASSLVDPGVRAMLRSSAPDQTVDVIVRFRGGTDLSRRSEALRPEEAEATLRELQTDAEASRSGAAPMLFFSALAGRVKRIDTLWIVNGVALSATPDVIQALSGRSDVLSITPDATLIQPVSSGLAPALDASPEPNVGLIRATDLWSLGYRGQGVVVASLDTGVDATHPDLSAQWRGGSNSWYDPNGQHAAPFDNNGHGTWTMGVMVGRGAGGTAIGVAPDAMWISAKIFDDAGVTSVSKVHQAFQWVLDPDNNPATPDFPNVVNNSWSFATPGCDLQFQPDLQALRALNILPVFAAGNAGPSASTDESPANNPGAFAVGAVNNLDAIYGPSSRGPSACGQSAHTFPDVVAPGVAVNTTDTFGGYYNPTGTSLAAPHVAGGVAVLLSTRPWLSPAQLEDALRGTAIDLGDLGPDNSFGYGRIDLLAAYQVLLTLPTPTPTDTPTLTSTATPTPTATSTSTPTPTSTAAPGLAGDANCDGLVTMTDALMIGRYVVGLAQALPCPQNADITGDGQIAMTDALAIARLVVGVP